MKIKVTCNKEDTKKIIEDYLSMIFKKLEGLPPLEFEVEFVGFK
jgi:hypothetical protein